MEGRKNKGRKEGGKEREEGRVRANGSEQLPPMGHELIGRFSFC